MFSKFLKPVLSLMAVVVVGFGLWSCSNDEHTNQKNSNADLLEKLHEYNQYDLSNLNYREGCSGFWDCLGHVTAVAGADIVGAATGVVAVKEAALVLGATTGGTGGAILVAGAGVVAGAGASYVAHKELKSIQSTPPTTPQARYGNLSIRVPVEFEYLSNVGIEHNTVIHNSFFNNEPLDNYYRSINLTENQKDVLNSEKMLEAIAIIDEGSAEYVINNFDYRNYTQKMVNEGLFTTNLKNVMDLFLQKYLSCTQDVQIENTINFYIEQVATSNLSLTEKEALIGAFMVASQSPYYFLNE